eukprot:TRINITY_DN5265_c0_g1_i1.p1 TRINITY_DN5265_c0_g1~~TRINITY_DN5265_c0_g1_i1.p1  ORF type:complete len:136 (-),score=24.46 TRINITY_DN5265_c0_g1_i1:23-430(-)
MEAPIGAEHAKEEETPDITKYRFVKRTVVRRGEVAKNDFYVSRDTQNVVVLKKAKKLLDNGEFSEVTIHGLGAAIYKAINIAQLLVSDSLGSLKMSPTTSTETLIDDYEPLCDDLEAISQLRYNSAIHIRVFKPS